MIRPPAWDGVAFSSQVDGDMSHDVDARTAVANRLAINPDWATVRQVHGTRVVRVAAPGEAGEADALWTTTPDVPLAILTADCFGVVLQADDAVGVAHCGWRGIAGGVLGGLRQAMTASGHEPRRASVGPGIGQCCFEVGPEVADEFEGHIARTTWNTTSVDLRAALRQQLPGLDHWAVETCTRHDPGWFSHRRDGDARRLAAIGWLR
ncbi:MAG: polyphenol oxidase family protein [Acidimicrobiia bacterium]|jgi:hypothetical protein